MEQPAHVSQEYVGAWKNGTRGGPGMYVRTP